MTSLREINSKVKVPDDAAINYFLGDFEDHAPIKPIKRSSNFLKLAEACTSRIAYYPLAVIPFAPVEYYQAREGQPEPLLSPEEKTALKDKVEDYALFGFCAVTLVGVALASNGAF